MGNRKKRVVISVLIVLVIIAVSCILNVPANKIKIVFDVPQKSITSGQSVVLYGFCVNY